MSLIKVLRRQPQSQTLRRMGFRFGVIISSLLHPTCPRGRQSNVNEGYGFLHMDIFAVATVLQGLWSTRSKSQTIVAPSSPTTIASDDFQHEQGPHNF